MKIFRMVYLMLVCLATLGYAEPVISVDTNRIITLAYNAIREARENVDPTTLQFSRITYFRSRRQKILQVIFIRSSIAGTVPTSNADAEVSHTGSLFTEVIVSMDESGEIQTVTDNEEAMRVIRDAQRRGKVSEGLGPV